LKGALGAPFFIDNCNPGRISGVFTMTDMNRDLFWKLLEAEHPKAERFCRRIAGDSSDGEDLYHDALLTAWRRFETLRNVESFRPWLYRIIVNVSKSRFRRLRRQRYELLEEQDDLAVDGRNQEDMLTARRWLERAFRVLSRRDRALVILFELEGWSIAEIAEMLGKPEGTIKSRLSRSRRKMRGEILKYLGNSEINQTQVEAEYALRGSKTTSE
jgi:RNA polymerase sigma-70 factor (ECF subfamily)